LKALLRQNATIETFSPLRSDFRYPLLPLKVAALFAGKNVFYHHFPLAMGSYARQVEQRIRSCPVDVLLSLGTQPWTLIRSNVPVVFYADAIFHMMPGYYGGVWDRLTLGAVRRGKWQEEEALKRCSIGVYASNWAAGGAKQVADPKKIRVVPFGASLHEEQRPDEVRRWAVERVQRMQAECHLLWIGVDWVRKGGGLAVETARILNTIGVKAKLTIVGCQPNGDVPEFVELRGFINKSSDAGRRELEELYRQATFFILPTRAEAAGIVFCEASAFGLPTITLRTGGVPDYVRDGVNGCCMPPDSGPDAFAANIRKMMENPEDYMRLSLGGFKEYTTRLNWDHCAACLVELCHEAAEIQQRVEH
jgi:glycosyltransferase involved in cell wall biosynthesis